MKNLIIGIYSDPANPPKDENKARLFLRLPAVFIFLALLLNFAGVTPQISLAQKVKARPTPKPAPQTSAGDKVLDEGLELFDKNDRQFWQMALAKFQEAQRLYTNSNDQEGAANALVLAARTYKKLGDGQATLDKYTAAYNIYKQINDREGQANALNNVGALYRDLGGYDNAVNYYQLALPLMRETNNKAGEGAVLNGLGESFRGLKKYDQALEHFNQALRVWIALNDPENTARSGTNAAILYSYSETTRPRALRTFNMTLEMARPLKKPALEGWILNNISQFYDYSGDKQKAVEYSQQALTLGRSMESDESKGMIIVSTFNLGFLAYRMANLEKAFDHLEAAQQMANQGGYLSILQYIYASIGECYVNKGEQAKALEYLNLALKTSDQIADKEGRPIILTVLGEASMLNLNTTDALNYLTQATKAAEEIKETSTQIRALSDMSRVYAYLNNRSASQQALTQASGLQPNDGNFEVLFEVYQAQAVFNQTFDSPPNAVQAFTESLNYSRKMGYKLGEARALYGLGSAYQKTGDSAKAMDAFTQALALQKKIGNQNSQASILVSIANQNFNLSQFPAAIQSLQEALSIAETNNLPYVRALALHDIGFAYAKMGSGDKAIEYYNQAIPVFQSLNEKQREARTYADLAIVYEAMGNKKKAKEFKKKAETLK